VRVATWNVNSLKARQSRVEEWLGYAAPDVLCLQETKLADAAFPAMDFARWGYNAAHVGEGRWNGVAVASRQPIDEVIAGFADDDHDDGEARLVTVTTAGLVVVSVYVPNGRHLGHEQYYRKLDWLDRLARHIDTVSSNGEHVLVCGDFNIAPEDRDVWDTAAVHGATHVSAPERARLAALLDRGFVDVFRAQYPDSNELFSWWDYRAGNFHKHKGMRIDLILASGALAPRCRFALIDRTARKGTAPSDHAPLFCDFDLEDVA
jgi:exodeoxyribonuclease III